MAYDEADKLEIPITKVQWALRGLQVFFAFLAMATISAVIGWDNRFFSASLFSVFFLFFILISMFFAAAIVVIPHLYITKGKFKGAARALRIPRIEFVLSAIWAVILFIVVFLLTIDVSVLRKCNPHDPKYGKFTNGSNNETFVNGLPTACRTQRAANAFGWFALTAWLCSLVLIANDWRKNRRPPAQQGPTIFPANQNSSSSTLGEQGLPDTSTRPAQENVPMQTIHSTPHPPPQPHNIQQIPPPSFPQQPVQTPPHQSPSYQQVPYNSPPLGPTQSPMPQPQMPTPGQVQGQNQGQGQQGQGQTPSFPFPEPQHFR